MKLYTRLLLSRVTNVGLEETHVLYVVCEQTELVTRWSGDSGTALIRHMFTVTFTQLRSCGRYIPITRRFYGFARVRVAGERIAPLLRQRCPRSATIFAFFSGRDEKRETETFPPPATSSVSTQLSFLCFQVGNSMRVP